jgi:hypothetical protein
MKDTTGLCDTLTKCVSSMENYFRKYIQDDFTNTYVTVGWCAEPEDNKPDINGNVWWYDGWDDPANGGSDKPYYVVDANWGNVKACNGAGMIMRGIEVDNSISIYANPDYFHTKWDISHEQPMFDYSPHPGQCSKSLHFIFYFKMKTSFKNHLTRCREMVSEPDHFYFARNFLEKYLSDLKNFSSFENVVCSSIQFYSLKF